MKLKFNLTNEGRIIKKPEVGEKKIKRRFLLIPKIYKTETCKLLCWLTNVYEEYEYIEPEWNVAPWGKWAISSTAKWEFKNLSTKKDYLRYKDRILF